MQRLTNIPGIGKTFEEDFGRIGIHYVEDVKGSSAEELFEKLVKKNDELNHKTSKLYLYVLKMVVYYANGGHDKEKLKWNYWKV